MLQLIKRAAASVTAAATGKVRLFVDTDGLFKTKDETGVVSTIGGVANFNGRNGNVVPQQADYDQFFTTTAEAAAAAPVQSFNGRTGAITPQQADYDAFFTTTSEAAAAAPVQSVNTKTGAVTLSTSDIGEGTNLYYTNGRASAAAPVQSVAGKTGAVTLDTSNVAENAANLYYTNARASAAAPVQSVFGRSGAVVAQQADYDAFFTTPAEAAAAAPVQSVDGRTGAVTFLRATRAAEFVSVANNATVQVAHSIVVPAARIVAGLTLELFASGTQTNAATNGGNNNIILQVNGATIATATVAVGATAQTNRAFTGFGAVTFRSATQVVGAATHAITGVLPVTATNAAAPTTIAAGDATITIAVQTATANAGNTIRVALAYIKEV
jgi:ethanolamine utilization protein EutP (predicted NTPase)